ncbi:Aminoglycoside phosphotransferase [Apiospora rasikravindrae]|uniref:Aminoglycoside phosphotransferase n=1 Tax=Apiospora rasikravindrae TaxID=990691 RepID=A0ABR1TA40_9PEZI
MGRIVTKEMDEAVLMEPFTGVWLLKDGKAVVKTGAYTREAQGNTMKFVRQHTSIPVPEVYNVYKDQRTGFWWSFIGAADGSACDDQFFCASPWSYGPYQTEEEFNEGLCQAWSKDREDEEAFTLLLCQMQRTTMHGHDIVMTHNDFAPRNILVRGSTVVAILDWEYSGFYPEYWEYCKSLWRPCWDSAWIKDGLVERVLDPYYKELAVILHTSNMW